MMALAAFRWFFEVIGLYASYYLNIASGAAVDWSPPSFLYRLYFSPNKAGQTIFQESLIRNWVSLIHPAT
jgi:hypothetical protein